MTSTTLKARNAQAFQLDACDHVTVANTFGQQVVDTWALSRDTPGTVLSMSHTRMALGRLYVRAGDTLYGTDREPLLLLASDTSPSSHDTLVPPCDAARYQQLGHEGHHDNCSENFRSALGDLEIAVPERVPAALNLFMNVPVTPDGRFEIEAPVSRPGDTVTLRALKPLVAVFSACPQDIVPTNGALNEPRDVEVEVSASSAVTSGR